MQDDTITGIVNALPWLAIAAVLTFALSLALLVEVCR